MNFFDHEFKRDVLTRLARIEHKQDVILAAVVTDPKTIADLTAKIEKTTADLKAVVEAEPPKPV